MTRFADDFYTEWLPGASEKRVRCEQDLIASGVAIPLRARAAWVAVQPAVRSSLLVVQHDNNDFRAAVGVEAHSSRALPGHVIWRIPRVGNLTDRDAAAALIGAVILAARQDRRVLRVHFEVFSRDRHVRDLLGALLLERGFVPTANTISYEYTLVTTLTGVSDEAYLASLARGVRQNIKEIAKYPVQLQEIRDVRESSRMNELMHETLARTGARHIEQDYAPLIRLSVESPTLARLVGLYWTNEGRPASLVGFALGVNNGDHATYDIGATARIAELRKLSMGYPLLWDLTVWARAQRLSWFDFGGVSVQADGEHDPVAGISDFKQRFTKEVVRVAEEWVWTPRPMRDRIARSVARGAMMMKGLRQG